MPELVHGPHLPRPEIASGNDLAVDLRLVMGKDRRQVLMQSPKEAARTKHQYAALARHA